MTPEIRHSDGGVTKENREAALATHAPLLGGLFEAAGTVLISVHSYKRILASGETKYAHASPLLRYQDNNKDKILIFKKKFGGTFRPALGYIDSYQWTVVGHEAVEVATAIQPFAPSRSEIIFAFRNWQNAEDNDEKLSIAHEVKGAAARQLQPREVYTELLENNAFLAGVFEAGGFLTVARGGKRVLVLNTHNTNLREAIKAEFGGSITTKKSGSLSLQIYREDAIARIFSLISPHLITPLAGGKNS